MPSALSVDLRERVIEAVEAGSSRRQAAERFGSGEGSAAAGPAALPPQVAEALSSAFAESLLMPAAALVVGAAAALALEQMRHQRG